MPFSPRVISENCVKTPLTFGTGLQSRIQFRALLYTFIFISVVFTDEDWTRITFSYQVWVGTAMVLYFGLSCSWKRHTQKYLLLSFVQNVAFTPEKNAKIRGRNTWSDWESSVCQYYSYCVMKCSSFMHKVGWAEILTLSHTFFFLLHRLIYTVAIFLFIAVQKNYCSFPL